MPFLFLSPSTQEFNPYITEGNEEYWMNLLADRMEPYLHASGVNTVRNDPAAGAAGAIRLSARSAGRKRRPCWLSSATMTTRTTPIG